MSGITDLSYSATTTTTATVSLEVETRVIAQTGADYKLETWYNLDATAEPQVDTVTVSQANLPAADAYYTVTIDGITGGARQFTWFYDQSTTPSEDDVAAALAELVNLHPDVSAVQGGTGAEETVIVTSNVPGTGGAFTLTVGCLQASDNSSLGTAISTTTTTSASGTGLVRKITEVVVGPSIDANKKPVFSVKSGSHFDGAASPTAVSAISAAPFTHPQTMDFIRAAQGE